VLLGVYDDSIAVPMLDFLLGEREIYASLSHTHDGDFPEAVRLLNDGAIDVSHLVSDRVPLTGVVNGFDELLGRPEDHLKILVFPNGVPTNGASGNHKG
jgi:(R,R)-butanediol dehydrogenase/meso-butanediol dehydrogenase/diacetyl reductase